MMHTPCERKKYDQCGYSILPVCFLSAFSQNPLPGWLRSPSFLLAPSVWLWHSSVVQLYSFVTVYMPSWFSPPPGWWLSLDMQSSWLCGLQFSCVCVRACVCACALFSVWLFTDPMDSSPPSSSVHGILQARILEWVAISFSRIFPTQGLKLNLINLLPWQVDSWALAPPGQPL